MLLLGRTGGLADRRSATAPPRPTGRPPDRPSALQEPSLSPEVFARRLERARAELQARKVDLLIATPGTNYEYLTGYNPGRSERLIALLLPVAGAPAIVCPAVEAERIQRHSVIIQLRRLEEQEAPHVLGRDTVRRVGPRSGEPGSTMRLQSAAA